jgi:purine nucleosidase
MTGEDGKPLSPLPSFRAESAHAVEALIETVNHAPGEVTLVTLGPMTNAALAIRRDPSFFPKVRRVVAMAGAFGSAGNVTPAAEYNVWADPEACRTVLEACGNDHEASGERGPELVFVGLDATHTLALQRDLLGEWIGERINSLNRFLWNCTAKTMAFHVREHGWDGMYLHDPMAVICAACPDLCGFETMHVNIECRGEFTRGMTVTDRRDNRLQRAGVPVSVCTSIRREETLELFRRGVFGERG